MSNEVVEKKEDENKGGSKFSIKIKDEKMQSLINDTLGDKEIARNFVADISSVVANNFNLQKCTCNSIVSGGLMAQRLGLPLASSLGFCALVPYKVKGYDVAQFQIMTKGLVQLAIRSGYYKTLGVRAVHEGEYAGQDKFGEDTFKFDHKFDNNKITGYYGWLQLLSGFEKTLYWTVEQCEAHALKYSKSHQYAVENKKTKDDLWSNGFEVMASKTVLKQLISKWGIMSVELQRAIESDQAVIDGDNIDYVDNPATADNVKAKEQEVKVNNETGEVIKDIEVVDEDSERKAKVDAQIKDMEKQVDDIFPDGLGI